MLSAHAKRSAPHDRRSGPPFRACARCQAARRALGLMTRESVYAFLLRLYPEASQRQYGKRCFRRSERSRGTRRCDPARRIDGAGSGPVVEQRQSIISTMGLMECARGSDGYPHGRRVPIDSSRRPNDVAWPLSRVGFVSSLHRHRYRDPHGATTDNPTVASRRDLTTRAALPIASILIARQ